MPPNPSTPTTSPGAATPVAVTVISTPEVQSEPTFIHRLMLMVAIVGGAVLLTWLLGAAQRVFVLLFTGIMLAVFLGALSDLVGRVTTLKRGWSLAIVVLLLFAIVIGSTVLVAPRVAKEAGQLSEDLPKGLESVRKWFHSFEFGRWAIEFLPNPKEAAAEKSTEIAGTAASAVSITFDVLGAVGIVMFVGLFFAIEPGRYVDGFLSLLPKRRRARVRQVIDESGDGLQRWLLGALLAGAFIGLLTSVGLMVIGVPLAFTLGIITGLLTMIPNFGPIASMVPPLLLATSQGPRAMLWVVLLYLGVQLLESNVVSTIIQRRSVKLAPNIIMASQLLFGLFAGVAGLIVATPFLVAASVAVKRLYIEDILGDREAAAS